MELNGLPWVFIVGCLGGSLVELLRWYRLRDDPAFDAMKKSPKYWIVTILMILAGGVIAALYGTEKRNALLVLQIGASTPALIGAFSSKPPSPPPPPGPPPPAPPPGGPPPTPEPMTLREFTSFSYRT